MKRTNEIYYDAYILFTLFSKDTLLHIDAPVILSLSRAIDTHTWNINRYIYIFFHFLANTRLRVMFDEFKM